METISNIFQNLVRQIGDSGLIIHAKAMMHQIGTRLALPEIERLLILLSSNESSCTNEMLKMKIISTLLYLQAELDLDKAAVFSAKMEQWHNMNRNLLRSSVTIDHLHIVFNLIEFEDKFRMLNSEKLKLLSIQLSTYEKLEKPFEEYILFKYYAAILKYHQKDYSAARNAYMDILIDIGEEVNNNEKSPLIQYIELKNQILNIKILERESGDREVLTNIDSMLRDYDDDFSDIAIIFGLKASDAYNNYYEFSKSAIALEKALKKIKERLLFANNKNLAEFIENYLVVLCRHIFCSIMQGKVELSMKFIQKLQKLLNLLSNSEFKPEESKLNLIVKYNFYLIIYKIIVKQPYDKNELNKSINLYREKFKNSVEIEDDTIINIYALNSTDVIAKTFFQKVSSNMSTISNNKLLPINYISLFYSLFNQISILTKNIATDSNTRKQAEYIDKIKVCSKTIIDYVNKYKNYQPSDLRAPFNYPYFKEVLIKIYFSFIFTFYFCKDYRKALESIAEYEKLKIDLNLEDGSTKKHCADVLKLNADILFKMEDFSGALELYLNVIQKYEEVLNHSQSMPLVLFNAGLCFFYTKEYGQAKKYLRQSLGKYETLNSINQNLYEDKIKQLGILLNAFSPMID
jgi:hypothetical protein